MFQEMTITDLNIRLGSIKHVALDMDGTIYKGNTLFPFTVKFLNDLKSLGIRYSFLTNNPSKSTRDYLTHLENMGIPASIEDIYTSGQATIDYLKYHHPKAKQLFILGTPSMIGEFERAGFISVGDNPSDIPDTVIIAFDSTLTYPRLCSAAWWLTQNLPYIATNPDRVCPTDLDTILVDCGSICSCLEKATGRIPDVVIGKPAPRMLEGIMRRYGLSPYEIAMVGDRIYTDISMAKKTNTLGVLVLTGEAKEKDLEKGDLYPDIIVKDISEFGMLLLNSNNNIYFKETKQILEG